MIQEERRQIITEWLETIQRDRTWLADQLHISKRTVDSWFSYRRISDSTWGHIESLMGDVGASPLEELLEIRLSLAEFEDLEKARIRAGYESRSAFYRDAIIFHIQKLLDSPPATRPNRSLSYHVVPESMLLNDRPDLDS